MKSILNYIFDFEFLEDGVAGVLVVAVRAGHGRIVAEFNHVSQTIPNTPVQINSFKISIRNLCSAMNTGRNCGDIP